MGYMWDRAVYRCFAIVPKGMWWNGKHWNNDGPHRCPRDTNDPNLMLCWQHREQVYQAVELSLRREKR